MKPSSFQETIENQFDYICKQVIEDERKDYFKHLDRLSAKEVSFSDIDNYLVNSFLLLIRTSLISNYLNYLD